VTQDLPPRERGILFSAPMVRAILAGKKTQTRRVVNPQPAALCRFEMNGAGTHALHLGPPPSMLTGSPFCCVPVGPKYTDHRLACPHGVPGDRLWVRETFSTDARSVYPCPPVWYRADFGKHDDPSDGEHSRGCDAGTTGQPVAECFACAGGLRWRPCLFMPRKLSRITLEITEVRVHRLHEISEDDARAEGCSGHDPGPVDQGGTIYAWKGRSSAPCPRAHFLALWDSLNGDRAPWTSNPWVWAITFQRLP